MLWSTAYRDEAEKCDVVTLLSDGKRLYDGPPETLTATIKDRVIRIVVPCRPPGHLASRARRSGDR